MNSSDLNLTGVMSAPVVPFRADTSLDLDAYRQMVKTLVDEGVTALFPCGSIGELPHLDAHEWQSVISATIELGRGGRVPVVATVGHPDLRRLREQIIWAGEAGADAVLVVPPYYFKLSEDEWLWAMRVVDGCGVPFIVYNNPSLGGLRVTLPALEQLTGMVNFVGLKEATTDPEDYRGKAALLNGRAPIIAAAETPLLQMLSIKADACLTAIASIAPAPLNNLWRAVGAGDLVSARAAFARISAFRQIVAAESAGGRPGYISVTKAALTLRGLSGGIPRPPLRPMAETHLPLLRAVLEKDLGIACTAPETADELAVRASGSC